MASKEKFAYSWKSNYDVREQKGLLSKIKELEVQHWTSCLLSNASSDQFDFIGFSRKILNSSKNSTIPASKFKDLFERSKGNLSKIGCIVLDKSQVVVTAGNSFPLGDLKETESTMLAARRVLASLGMKMEGGAPTSFIDERQGGVTRRMFLIKLSGGNPQPNES